jgi:flavin reductase (DIM6/NTAB) family NADH-FMN oxidoreductase RutF
MLQKQTISPAMIDATPISMTVASEEFVAAMRVQATAVNVVTTDGPAGRFGITVSAVASVSAEPPLILACVNRKSPTVAAIRRNGVFCVNALNARQHGIADVFAGRSSQSVPFDFDCALWVPGVSGSPELGGALASLDCTLFQAIDAGTHTIFIGAVIGVISRADTPLLHCDRRFATAIGLA